MKPSRSVQRLDFAAIKQDFDELIHSLRLQKQSDNAFSSRPNLTLKESFLPLIKSRVTLHENTSSTFGRKKSDTIIRSLKIQVNDDPHHRPKYETLKVNVRPPWRQASSNTNEAFSKQQVLTLSPEDIKPRDLFIIKNLILPRSLNDNRIDGKTPFRVNSRVDPLIFEQQAHLREKTKRITENKKTNFESQMRIKREEEMKIHSHRREIFAIDNIVQCQTS